MPRKIVGDEPVTKTRKKKPFSQKDADYLRAWGWREADGRWATSGFDADPAVWWRPEEALEQARAWEKGVEARQVAAAVQPPKTGFRSAPKVEGHAVEAAPVVTVGMDPAVPGTDLTGAFVRIRADGDQAAADRLVAAYRQAGVAAVKVVMPPKAKVLPALAAKARGTPGGIRGVVSAMLAEANTKDPEALRALVESTMAKVGL